MHFGLVVAPHGIPADSVEERSKTWRLGVKFVGFRFGIAENKVL